MSTQEFEAELLQSLGDAFGFLQADHGMTRSRQEIDRRLLIVEYRRPGVTFLVTLDVSEWILSPEVLVDQGRGRLPASLDLNFLLIIAGRPDLATTQDHVIAAESEGRLPDLFAKVADDLKQYGAEALRGEAEIVDVVRDRFYSGVPGDPLWAWWVAPGQTEPSPVIDRGAAVRRLDARGVTSSRLVDPFTVVHFDTMPDNSGSFIELSDGMDGSGLDMCLDHDGASGCGRVTATIEGPGHLRLAMDRELAAKIGCEPEVDIHFPADLTSDIEVLLTRLIESPSRTGARRASASATDQDRSSLAGMLTAVSVAIAESGDYFDIVHFDTVLDGSGPFLALSTGSDDAGATVLLDIDGTSGDGRVFASMVAPGYLRLAVEPGLAASVGCEAEIDVHFPVKDTADVEKTLAKLPVRFNLSTN